VLLLIAVCSAICFNCSPVGEALSASKIRNTLDTTPTGADFDGRVRSTLWFSKPREFAVLLFIHAPSTRTFQAAGLANSRLPHLTSAQRCILIYEIQIFYIEFQLRLCYTASDPCSPERFYSIEARCITLSSVNPRHRVVSFRQQNYRRHWRRQWNWARHCPEVRKEWSLRSNSGHRPKRRRSARSRNRRCRR
jgi:hypothetical protein